MTAGRNTALVILLMILVGGLAGSAGGVLTERYSNYFELPEEHRGASGNISGDVSEEVKLAQQEVNVKNNALVLGLAGCVLGAVLGLVTGWIRRSIGVAVIGLLLVAVLGGGFGVLGGLGSQFTWQKLATQDWDQLNTNYAMEPATLKASSSQAAGWMILAVGIALGCGLLVPPRFKSMLKLLVPALGAALAAGFLTPFLTAVLFPNARGDFPVPVEPEAQIFWAALAGGLITLAVGRTVNSLVRNAATTAPALTPGGETVTPALKA